jgi:hypothetical protein
MTERATVDRVTFFNADNKTVFEVHNVPVGTDAQKYAHDWVEQERRQARPSRSYVIERDSVRTPPCLPKAQQNTSRQVC